MRNAKRYTNTTFTKRIDHESGHKQKGANAEPCVCALCGAVYLDRRWSIAESNPKSLKHQRWRKPQIITCPACRQKKEGVPGGYLHLKGAFLEKHAEEIERLLRNEAERAAMNNPLARIMNWDKEGDNRLKITTTTEHLVQRLGHALAKAFCGEVRYDFSHENKVAHVWWQRD